MKKTFSQELDELGEAFKKLRRLILNEFAYKMLWIGRLFLKANKKFIAIFESDQNKRKTDE